MIYQVQINKYSTNIGYAHVSVCKSSKIKKPEAQSVVLNVKYGSQSFLIRQGIPWRLVAGSDGSAKEILYHTSVSTILALINHILSLKGFETCVAPDIIFPKIPKGNLTTDFSYISTYIHWKVAGVSFLITEHNPINTKLSAHYFNSHVIYRNFSL